MSTISNHSRRSIMNTSSLKSIGSSTDDFSSLSQQVVEKETANLYDNEAAEEPLSEGAPNKSHQSRVAVCTTLRASSTSEELEKKDKVEHPTRDVTSSLKSALKLSTSTRLSRDTKLTAFQLQYFLRAMGVLIPTEDITSIFTHARTMEVDGKGSHPDLDGCYYSISIEILEDILEQETRFKRGFQFKYQVLKNIFTHFNSALAHLYIIAGVLLIVGSLTCSNGMITPVHCKNLYLTVSLMYIIHSGKYLIDFPLNEYRARVQSETMIHKFKESILNNIVAPAISASAQAQSKGEVSLEMESRNLFQYIENSIFLGDQHKMLTKRDLEMLLLRELGMLYDPRALSDLVSSMDEDNSWTISAVDFHYFLAYTSKNRRVWSVFEMTVTSFSYYMTLFFFLGSFLNLIANILSRFDVNLSVILVNTDVSLLSAWFFKVGTFAFTVFDYNRLRDVFDKKEKAKKMVGKCVKYASYYHRNSKIWIQYNSEKGLDINNFQRLLQEASISMSESEVNVLFSEIDVDGSKTLSKKEIEQYLEKVQHRWFAISWMCLRDVGFWANSLWWIGSIFYLCCFIKDISTTQSIIFDFLGSVGYFIGGIAYCRADYTAEADKLKYKQELVTGIRKLLSQCNYTRGLTQNLIVIDNSFANRQQNALVIDDLLQRNNSMVSNIDGSYGLEGLCQFFEMNSRVCNLKNLELGNLENLFPKIAHAQCQLNQYRHGKRNLS